MQSPVIKLKIIYAASAASATKTEARFDSFDASYEAERPFEVLTPATSFIEETTTHHPEESYVNRAAVSGTVNGDTVKNEDNYSVEKDTSNAAHLENKQLDFVKESSAESKPPLNVVKPKFSLLSNTRLIGTKIFVELIKGILFIYNT